MMRKLALVFICGVGTKGRGGEKENHPSHAGRLGMQVEGTGGSLSGMEAEVSPIEK